ncbi:unnamed protein product [Closterium sp. NIES-65]|nr:unnamed protein product [Closterium sp. NIES-65]
MPVSCRTRVATPAFFLPFPLVPPVSHSSRHFPFLPPFPPSSTPFPFLPPFPLLSRFPPHFPPPFPLLPPSHHFSPFPPLSPPLCSLYISLALVPFPPCPFPCFPLPSLYLRQPSLPLPLLPLPFSFSQPALSLPPHLPSWVLPLFLFQLSFPLSPPHPPRACIPSRHCTPIFIHVRSPLLTFELTYLHPLPHLPSHLLAWSPFCSLRSPFFPPLSPLFPALPSFPRSPPYSPFFPPLSPLSPRSPLFLSPRSQLFTLHFPFSPRSLLFPFFPRSPLFPFSPRSPFFPFPPRSPLFRPRSHSPVPPPSPPYTLRLSSCPLSPLFILCPTPLVLSASPICSSSSSQVFAPSHLFPLPLLSYPLPPFPALIPSFPVIPPSSLLSLLSPISLPFPPLLTSLDLDSPWERCTISSYTNNRTSRAPLHAFPALRSLSLLLPVSHLDSLPHCSFLTPLALFNPHPSTLSSLASSSSAVRPILKTLNLKSAELTACLAPLASFPSLSSLDLQTCSIDPFELHALSRSLHTLTDLGIINCPLISSHSLATLAQTNLALSSLSLHTTSYHLFSAQGLWSLFHAPPAHLHTLSFSGLPSFRPGLLAHCSGLQSLTIAGRWEIAPRFSVRGCDDEAGQEMERMGWGFDDDWLTWGGSFGEVDLGEAAAAAAVPTQQVSLESLVSMLVVVVRRGGGEGGVGVECKEEGGVGGEEGEVEESEVVEEGKRQGAVAILDQAAATEREHAMIEAFSAAGVFVKRESQGGEGEGGAGLLEEIDGILLGNDVAGTGSDGDGAGDADGGGEREGEGAAGNVSPRATALGVIQTLMWQLGEERRNTYETFERMRWRVARGAAGWPAHEAGLAAAAGGILGGAAAAAAASADAGEFSLHHHSPAYLAASAPPLCIPSHVLHIFQSTLLILLCVSLPEPECPASDL